MSSLEYFSLIFLVMSDMAAGEKLYLLAAFFMACFAFCFWLVDSGRKERGEG